jgi:hypothetical protein
MSAALDVLPNLTASARPQAQTATGTGDVLKADPSLARFSALSGGRSGDERSRGGLIDVSAAVGEIDK